MESLLDKCLKTSSDLKLSNYQLKSNEVGDTSDYADCALNFSLLNSEKAIEILKSNCKLKNEFFRFELYRQSSFSKEILDSILTELICPSNSFEDIIDYCFESEENRKILENVIKVNKQMIMENQVSRLLIKLIKVENLSPSDNFKIFSKTHGLKNNSQNYQIYLIFLLLIEEPNSIDMNLFYKSLIKEINLKALDQENSKVEDDDLSSENNDEDLFSFNKKFDVNIVVDLVHIMFHLIKILTNEAHIKSCFKYFNTLSKILFHYCKQASSNTNNFKYLNNFYEEFMKDEAFKAKIESMKDQDSKVLKLKSHIDNFYMLKKFYVDRVNREKHFIFDVINI